MTYKVTYLCLNKPELEAYYAGTYAVQEADIGTAFVEAESKDEAIGKATKAICDNLDGNGLCYLVAEDGRIDLFEEWNRLDEIALSYFSFEACEV